MLDPLHQLITPSTKDHSMGVSALHTLYASNLTQSLFCFKYLIILGISNVDGILWLGYELPRIVYIYWSTLCRR